jgi:hypothetical protein
MWLPSHLGCFTPKKKPWYPLNIKLGQSQSWSKCSGEEKVPWLQWDSNRGRSSTNPSQSTDYTSSLNNISFLLFAIVVCFNSKRNIKGVYCNYSPPQFILETDNFGVTPHFQKHTKNITVFLKPSEPTLHNGS